jgi:hypothetical protein
MEIAMSKIPNLYDLYSPTSLLNLQRSIGEGKVPTGREIAAVLEANSGELLPPWFLGIVAKCLRGELKRKKGRPKKDWQAETCFEIAKWKYPAYVAWLQKRQSRSGLKGWPAVEGKDWWTGPPYERAARILTQRWLKHVTWRSFLNRVSS